MKTLCCGFFALLLTATMSASAATAMKAGFAKSKITPPVGTPMTGFGNRDYDPSGSRAVHDDLFARALYLALGKCERDSIRGADGLVLEEGNS
jgi:hypothetical protein